MRQRALARVSNKLPLFASCIVLEAFSLPTRGFGHWAQHPTLLKNCVASPQARAQPTPESYTELVSSLLVWAPNSSTAETLEPHSQFPSDPGVQHHIFSPQNLAVQVPQAPGPPELDGKVLNTSPSSTEQTSPLAFPWDQSAPGSCSLRTQEYGGRHGARCCPEARAQAHCLFSLQACLPTAVSSSLTTKCPGRKLPTPSLLLSLKAGLQAPQPLSGLMSTQLHLHSVLVTQSCPTLCHPMNCSPPGSSVHRILQARILEWVGIPFSRGSSPPRDGTEVSCFAGRFFTIWDTKEAHVHSDSWNSSLQSHLCESRILPAAPTPPPSRPPPSPEVPGPGVWTSCNRFPRSWSGVEGGMGVRAPWVWVLQAP